MILGKVEIEKLIQSENIIENYESSLSDHNPAKVELRLGSKCYLSSRVKDIIELSENDTVVLNPNDMLLYQTLEKMNMPNNIAGHTSLKMGYTARGLLMSSQTQVDPGYNNYLFGMLYNLSNDNIELKYGEPIITLELHQTKNADAVSYRGRMKNISFEEFCKTRTGTSLRKVSEKLEEQTKIIKDLIEVDKKNDKRLNALMAIVGFATFGITIISVVVALFAIRPDAEVTRLSEKISYQQQIISELQQRIEMLESEDNSVIIPEIEKGISVVENNDVDGTTEGATTQCPSE